MTTGALFGTIIALVWFAIIINAFKRKNDTVATPTNTDTNTRKEVFTSDIVDMRIQGLIHD